MLIYELMDSIQNSVATTTHRAYLVSVRKTFHAETYDELWSEPEPDPSEPEPMVRFKVQQNLWTEP